MSHLSPASLLIWSVLSCLLFTFLVYHLWSFDRFKCLKWNSGPQSGAFKRIMTYSYLLSVPLITIYAVGFTVIKYQEGFVDLPLVGIVPKPHQMWKESSKAAIFPFTLMFSCAWALEIVSHLEELCFWYFLVNAGSSTQDWFKSFYFRGWVVGSSVAVVGMPLLTILTRGDHNQNEAYTVLAGGLSSLMLTIAFVPVLLIFPRFLATLKTQEVDVGTVVRLTTFHEMNNIRVFFRFLFTIPFVVLGIDGCRPHKHVNESMLWTDLLSTVAAFGCVVSSGITLTIFFPRSIEGEMASKEARKAQRTRSYSMHHSNWSDTGSMTENRDSTYSGTRLTTSGQNYPSEDYQSSSPLKSVPLSGDAHAMPQLGFSSYSPRISQIPIRPNRRVGEDVELGGIGSTHGPQGSAVTLNPAVYKFKSPIDVAYYQSPAPVQDGPRYRR